MLTPIAPTTVLEAVNECLENIGQAPVSSVSGALGVDARIALNFVNRVNRELQSKGWRWNTEEDYPLNPNSNKDILLPAGTVYVEGYGEDAHRDLLVRGARLYDREKHSYTFEESVKVSITFNRNFDEIPETARRYIAMRSARLFQNRVEGREDESDLRDELTSWNDLVAEELRSQRNNALHDNATSAQTLRRHSFGYTGRFV